MTDLQTLLTNSGKPFQIHHHSKTILVSIEFKTGLYSEHICLSDESETGMIKQVEKVLKANSQGRLEVPSELISVSEKG